MESKGQHELDKLLDMQRQLMEKVPHGLRREVYAEVMCVKDIMEKSLLFLSSIGHKPWRPNPLEPGVQQHLLDALSHSVDMLLMTHGRGFMPTLRDEEYDEWTRKLISVFGIVEEAIEYLNAGSEPRPRQLEEATDILFFYLESVILGGFNWQEIEEEYVRKHAVNLERYRKAKEGDYSWDKRGEGGL